MSCTQRSLPFSLPPAPRDFWWLLACDTAESDRQDTKDTVTMLGESIRMLRRKLLDKESLACDHSAKVLTVSSWGSVYVCHFLATAAVLPGHSAYQQDGGGARLNRNQ